MVGESNSNFNPRVFHTQWKWSEEGRIDCLKSDREHATKETAPEIFTEQLVFAKRTVLRRMVPVSYVWSFWNTQWPEEDRKKRRLKPDRKIPISSWVKYVRKGMENTIWYYLYLESNIQHKWNLPQKSKSRNCRIDLWLPSGEGKGVIWLGCLGLIDKNYLEWISNEILLCSTGNNV